MRKTLGTLAFVVGLVGAAAQADAALLLHDTFDDENAGTGALNYTGFRNWTVNRGAVDLIGRGFFDYYPTSGLYIDMDGSGRAAGAIQTRRSFGDRGTYTLRFDLGGSRRGNGVNRVRVDFGAAYSELFSLPSTAPLSTVTRTIEVDDANGGVLSFSSPDPVDFMGLILDNVSVEGTLAPVARVPEPGMLGLLGAGLAALGLAVRRARRR